MSKFLGALILCFASLGAEASEPATWGVDPKVLSCSFSTLGGRAAVELRLAPGHGQELAVRRLADSAWFFLVVGLPASDEPQLMSTSAFGKLLRVKIPAGFVASVNGTSKRESVFSRRGTYEIYVSDNLESEVGGYKCAVRVSGMSPNNSFKPTPLRGAA